MKANSDRASIPHALRQRWWALAAGSLGAWAGCAWLLTDRLPRPEARSWALASGIALAYILAFSFRHLSLNVRIGETEPLQVFGPGNALTLMRGTCIGLLAGFLLLPRPAGWLGWMPALLYGLVEVGDFLDGYLARMTNTATRLGERLDIEFDALGLLMASSVVVHWGTMPLGFMLVGIARYAYLLGLWWNQKRGRTIYPLPESDLRRPIAGVMMIFTSALLWPIVPLPAARAAGCVIGIPFLVGFARDYLVVSGRLAPASPRYLAVRAQAKLLLRFWLPPMLRVVALAAWGLAVSAILPEANQPHPARILVVLTGVPVVLLVLGIAGRLAALVATILSAVTMVFIGTPPALLALMTCTLALLLTGTGPGSLWRGDAFLVNWRPGARADAGV